MYSPQRISFIQCQFLQSLESAYSGNEILQGLVIPNIQFLQTIKPTHPSGFFITKLHSLNVNSSNALRVHIPEGISSRALQPPMPNIVKHVNPLKPSGIILKGFVSLNVYSSKLQECMLQNGPRWILTIPHVQFLQTTQTPQPF